MKSTASQRFWKCYRALPVEVKNQAKNSFSFLLEYPYHPSLHFKRIHSTRPIYSVRVSYDYRAVGIVEGDEITWFWIGPHAGYDKIVKKLRT